MLIFYHFSPEKLNGIPKKVELVEAVTDFFIKDWEGLVQRDGGGMSVVTNDSDCEAGE